MGYAYKLDKYYVVKKEGEYPWPCQSQRKRTIELFTNDVLTKNSNGTFTIHTGICCFGIRLKKNQVKLVKKPVGLEII